MRNHGNEKKPDVGSDTCKSGRVFGYCRVSAKDQNEARQVIAIRAFGVREEMIFIEKRSGKDFERPVYQKIFKMLRPGDTLVIKSIDRLGRNYEEIIEQWRLITKVKRAWIVVLDMPLLDTRGEQDLTGTLVADLVLQLLSYVAEQERQFIRQRQAEGIAAARARGVRFGAPMKDRPDNYAYVAAEWAQGMISLREAARRCGVAHTTFARWARNDEN